MATSEIAIPGVTDHPTRDQVEEAVRTLIRWAGDNPSREGLRDTPGRVARAWKEYFAGYSEDPAQILARTFDEVNGYNEMIVMSDIRFESHCEHHIAPIIGTVKIGYVPERRVVGISKLARLVDIFAKRLQIQERMTAQIADAIQDCLQPRGVAVVVEASHQCMTTRGVQKPGTMLTTRCMRGVFQSDQQARHEFFETIRAAG